MKRWISVLFIIVLSVVSLPVSAMTSGVRTQDGTRVLVARTPDQCIQISTAAPGIEESIEIDPSDGSLADGEGSMSDILPITKEEEGRITSFSKAKNKKKILSWLDQEGLYSVSDNEDKIRVAFPYSAQRLVVESTTLTTTCDASSAIYYERNNEYILSYDSQEETQAAYESLAEEYGEDRVILDLPVHADANKSWGIDTMNLTKVRDLAELDSSRNKTLAALIDSGVNTSHEIFKGRTFSRQSKNIIKASSSYKDDSGHGTHTAGILAEGTSGDVEFLVLKVLNSKGEGSMLNVLRALEYAMSCGADIANLSLGMNIADYTGTKDEIGITLNTTTYVNYLESFLKLFCKSGLIMVTASGNEGRNMASACTYPASSGSVISVGALDSFGQVVNYSNYGSALDFVAPGYRVKGASIYSNSYYVTLSGTSMAAPHIAAAAAMIKVYHPDYSFGDIYSALKSYTGHSSKVSSRKGYGMPDFTNFSDTKNVINRSSVSVGKVTGVRVSSLSYKRQKVSWNPLEGASGYVVYRKKGALYRPVADVSSTSASFGGLTCGKNYKYKVKAYRTEYNKRMWGSLSAAVRGKPVPAATEKVTVKTKGKKISMKWKKVSGANGYLVFRRASEKSSWKKLINTSKLKYVDHVSRKKSWYYRVKAYRKVKGKKVYGKNFYYTVIMK